MNPDLMKSNIGEEAQAKAKDAAFASFLDMPTTKFVLSFIPPGKEEDAVKTVLRASFDAGFGCGAGFFMTDLLKTLMLAKDKRP